MDRNRGARGRGFHKKTAAHVLGILFGAAALAKTPPPVVDESISESDTSWRAASKTSSGLTMGKMQIQFEETTLSEVMRTVKSGSIQHQGDAAGSVYWLCYRALTDGYTLRIWLEASGEMGGPENRITSIAVQRITDSNQLSDCPALPKQFEPLSFNNGVWIGTSIATVGKAFSTGLLRAGEHAFIGYHGKVSDNGKCDGGYDLLNSLYLTFQAGLVVAIDAGQVTSC